MVRLNREKLGELVRNIWIAWAMKQPHVKSSWVVPYESLSDADQEADRMIGEGVASFVLQEQQEQGYRPVWKGNLEILHAVTNAYLDLVKHKAFEGDTQARDTIIAIEGARDEIALLIGKPTSMEDESSPRFQAFRAHMLGEDSHID